MLCFRSVDNTEMKGPIGPEVLVFPQPHLLEVSEASTRHLVEALEITAATCDPKEKGPVDGNSEELR